MIKRKKGCGQKGMNECEESLPEQKLRHNCDRVSRAPPSFYMTDKRVCTVKLTRPDGAWGVSMGPIEAGHSRQDDKPPGTCRVDAELSGVGTTLAGQKLVGSTWQAIWRVQNACHGSTLLTARLISGMLSNEGGLSWRTD